MEGIGLAASITNLLEFAKDVIQYMKDVYEATEQKQMLLQEVDATREVLARLNRYSTESKWKETMDALMRRQGPLEQLSAVFKRIESKLKPPTGKWSKATKALIWPFTKGEVALLLTRIERIKALLNIALQNEHLFVIFSAFSNCRALTEAIQASVNELGDVMKGKSAIGGFPR